MLNTPRLLRDNGLSPTAAELCSAWTGEAPVSTIGSIAAKASMGLGPAILCMIRGYSTSRDSEDRICQRSVWICQEQAFWLVSHVVLLYTLIERKDPTVSSP
jgi:hypothetical protein